MTILHKIVMVTCVTIVACCSDTCIRKCIGQEPEQANSWSAISKRALQTYLKSHSLYARQLDNYIDGTFYLNLSGDKTIKDLAILSGIPLRHLDVSNTQAFHLNGIVVCHAMEELFLANTMIEDINACKEFRGLTRLNIALTKVTDVSPLTNTPIRFLTVASSPITNLELVADMKYLAALDLSTNQVTKELRRRLEGRSLCINGYHGTNFWVKYDAGALP